MYCLLLLFAQTLVAQSLTELPVLYDDERTQAVQMQKQTYKQIDDQSLELFIYELPSQELRPVVVFINGVGSEALPQWRVYQDWARLTAARGLVAITYEAQYESVAEDTQQMFAFLREQAKTYHLDMGRVGIWCCSGNVPIGVQAAAEQAGVQCLQVFYGHADPSLLKRETPTLLVRSGMDRYDLNLGMQDMALRLMEMDGQLDWINLPGARHAFDVLDDTWQTADAIERSLIHMQRNLTATRTSTMPLSAQSFAQLARTGEWSVAEAAYRKAHREKDPKQRFRGMDRAISSDSLTDVAAALVDWDMPDKADKALALALDLYPKDPFVRSRYASINLAQGMFDEAKVQAEMALELAETEKMHPRWKERVVLQAKEILDSIQKRDDKLAKEPEPQSN